MSLTHTSIWCYFKIFAPFGSTIIIFSIFHIVSFLNWILIWFFASSNHIPQTLTFTDCIVCCSIHFFCRQIKKNNKNSKLELVWHVFFLSLLAECIAIRLVPITKILLLTNSSSVHPNDDKRIWFVAFFSDLITIEFYLRIEINTFSLQQ